MSWYQLTVLGDSFSAGWGDSALGGGGWARHGSATLNIVN
jgi:hypothetical protein